MTLTEKIFRSNGCIYPANLSARPIKKINPSIEIRDKDRLVYWYNLGYRRFIFQPYGAGLIGIDADCKNNKDGIRELISITGNEPDFYTETPSGGRHYYFLSDGRDYISSEIRPGLEIKSRAFITIPGSCSDKGRYIQHGDALNIGPLPESLRQLIPVRNTNPAPLPQRAGDSLGLNKIMDILSKQGLAPIQGQRNRFCFEAARFARKQGHRQDEVVGFLSFLSSGDFPPYEIRAAVQSAYRGAR